MMRARPTPTPPAVSALAAVTLALIVLPVFALGARVPWADLGAVLRTPETHELLRVTVASATLATVIAVALGTPLALWLQRVRRGSSLTRLLVLLPLAMPPVVAGLALSALIGRRGLAAPLLDALHWQFAFAFPGVVAAHVYVALPFVVITLDSALRQLGPEVAASAEAVGIPPGRIIRRIILPAIAPALVTAAGLAFARSLGEFGTTLTFAGSMPGTTRTMPLGIYLAREVDQSLAYGLSAILVGFAVLALVTTALPAALAQWRGRHRPAEQPRETGTIDAAKFSQLTRPAASGEEVRAGATRFPANATTALIGPNGAGKTTLARGVAKQRGVVLLTQDPALPPTATPRTALAMVTRSAEQLLRAAGLASLADVPVPALSGGQAAQVALVRALAARPRVLILDEPLAAIDAATTAQWRRLLQATARERTTIVVTHDAIDVATLADHVAVMRCGSVVSLRPAADELAAPATAFSARLLGMNLLADLSLLEGPPLTDTTVPRPLRASFPPDALSVIRTPQPAGSHLLRGRVSAVELLPGGGAAVELAVGGDAEHAENAEHYVSLLVDRDAVLRQDLAPGTQVTCALDVRKVRLIPAEHG